jgi:hypothetical protein
MGAIRVPLPCTDGVIHVGDDWGLDRPVQLEQAHLSDLAVQRTLDQVDGPGVADHLLVLL